MSNAKTILVVDDDPSIVELMRDFLENDGFRVDVATSADEALDVLKRASVDCMLLDVMMPGQTGFDLCKQIRIDRGDVPILFLSARDNDVDKIRGLGIGGDDYIVKSASPAEVVARVKAVLRRMNSKQSSRQVVLDYGRLVLNISAREVTVSEQYVSLTPKEFDLLCLLAEHPRQVFTYEYLLAKFWEGIGDRHTVRVHIARIREKIERDANKPEFIINVWGVGYRFEGTPK
ncbi:response regulator transcription factor [Alicyclobacillus acidiphilus]|uniref:response regulator transcription factor n=1 Tax=Alicyclobacillus acidiphilus TaxID=182455 RepID=UPI00082CD026|nr:response regulator transcription factor [Alicyclobacillus acidiphilus]